MNLDVVTIRPENKDIVVCRALLSAVSPYFKKAFSGPFTEAKDRAISLPDVSERTFRAFLQWLQTHNTMQHVCIAALDANTIIPPDKIGSPATGDTERNNADVDNDNTNERSDRGDTMTDAPSDAVAATFDEEGFHEISKDLENPAFQRSMRQFNLNMAQLFVFANRYLVSQLRDDIMTAHLGQCRKWRWWPDDLEIDLVRLVDSELPMKSKFTKFLACSIAWLVFYSCEVDAAHRLRDLQDLS